MTTQRVAVVGAGIAGLTAAYRLKQAGLDVEAFDSRPYVGGRMSTLDWEGFRINPGAQFVTGSDRALLQMAQDLGLGDQVRQQQGEGLTLAVYRDGRIHPVNFLSIRSYLTWRCVSLGARLAMLRLLPHMLRYRGGDVYHMERGPGEDAQSVEAFFYEQVSAEMYEYWAYPTFETNCSYDGGDLSKKAFLSLVMGHMGSQTYYFRDGIGVLGEAMSKVLPIHVNAAVERVTCKDGGVELAVNEGGVRRTVRADRAVLAVPGHLALRIIEAPRPAWQAFLSQVRYVSSATQFFVFEAPGFDPGTAPARGVMFPRTLEGLSIADIYFQQRQGDRFLAITEPRAHTYAPGAEPDVIWLERAWADIVRVYPALHGTLKASRLFPWPEKVPAFPPGYLDATAAFWRDPQEDPVFFCGDYLAGPGTGAALFTGLECAERILERLHYKESSWPPPSPSSRPPPTPSAAAAAPRRSLSCSSSCCCTRPTSF